MTVIAAVSLHIVVTVSDIIKVVCNTEVFILGYFQTEYDH